MTKVSSTHLVLMLRLFDKTTALASRRRLHLNIVMIIDSRSVSKGKALVGAFSVIVKLQTSRRIIYSSDIATSPEHGDDGPCTALVLAQTGWCDPSSCLVITSRPAVTSHDTVTLHDEFKGNHSLQFPCHDAVGSFRGPEDI